MLHVVLATIQPWRMGQDIVSRGRFGAWMYEIGTTDHSVMQGVEAINWLLEGEPETTWTGAQPKPVPAPPRPYSLWSVRAADPRCTSS